MSHLIDLDVAFYMHLIWQKVKFAGKKQSLQEKGKDERFNFHIIIYMEEKRPFCRV